MTEDDFMTAIDGLEFDDDSRTWTLEVTRVDDVAPDSFVVTVLIRDTGEMSFDVSRKRRLNFAALQDHVVAVAKDIVGGRRQSGTRVPL